MDISAPDQDKNIVEIWLRKDPIRWMAGVLGGLFAGVIALLVGMILSGVVGNDIWFTAKVAALPILGASALEYGAGSAVTVGLIALEVLCAFFGVIFAHFTGTNAIGPLFGVGVTWGAFTWIFINNLFSKSFHDVYAADVSAAGAFAVCMAYGISLISVAFFDRILRGRR